MSTDPVKQEPPQPKPRQVTEAAATKMELRKRQEKQGAAKAPCPSTSRSKTGYHSSDAMALKTAKKLAELQEGKKALESQLAVITQKTSELTLPMLEVAGHTGPALVFRPWTNEDMKAYMQQLPNVVEGGKKFCAAIKTFCMEVQPTWPELRRLLLFHMGQTNFDKIKGDLVGEYRVIHLTFDDAANNHYRAALDKLCATINRAFPRKVVMSKVKACVQQMAESTKDYFSRLLAVHNEYSGVDEPSDLGDVMGHWESAFSQYFLNGLLPDVFAVMKDTCLDMKNARLEKLRKHAKCAHEKLKDEREAEDKLISEAHRQTQLTLAHTVTKPAAHFPRGRGRGRGNWKHQQPAKKPPNSYCYICGDPNYWVKDCPKRIIKGETVAQAD
ncbi:uncharacterized protein LOC106533992 [Austrofundulus limnaeus]|uniref:Uncharacterized protein LOC106533992 n=1 Tax=Austrofundulus limnaeus TaxID=52670 RepID=A0A2I4D111_AUSLI|nr:PREDICTED: uncharacterized protein LOC106533992 [Austrofundulus limnaeus]XP_013885941.1 PREDICTED: uncharacterized protein LOC106533992 [Austrofundulus limnaeus]